MYTNVHGETGTVVSFGGDDSCNVSESYEEVKSLILAAENAARIAQASPSTDSLLEARTSELWVREAAQGIEECAHCGSEPEDSTRCVYCGKPGPGVTMILTYRQRVEQAEKEAAEKALLQYRNPLLWPSPIQPPYIATCQTEQNQKGDTQ